MIGNDLVNIKSAFGSKNDIRMRFLKKIFSEKEQQQILKTGNPALFVWLFWSMKEAAYKAHQRRFNHKRRNNPLDFECQIDYFTNQEAKGRVFTKGEVYFTQSSFNTQYIHSLASLSSDKKIEFQIFDSTSEKMKLRFKEKISAAHSIPLCKIKLEYNEHRIPQLFLNSEKLNIPFSFSQHGKFSAYAVALN